MSAKHETCARCQGNGEIVVDWHLYLHGNDDEAAVADCPDCDGTGTIPPRYAPDPSCRSAARAYAESVRTNP